MVDKWYENLKRRKWKMNLKFEMKRVTVQCSHFSFLFCLQSFSFYFTIKSTKIIKTKFESLPMSNLKDDFYSFWLKFAWTGQLWMRVKAEKSNTVDSNKPPLNQDYKKCKICFIILNFEIFTKPLFFVCQKLVLYIV